MASNFSKRHYIQIAEVLREHRQRSFHDIANFTKLYLEFVEMFKKDNSNFKEYKFEKAIYK